MLNLVHRARLPEHPKGRRWPAVVMVHGWQGTEAVMGIFERCVPAGTIIVSPRAPLEVAPQSYGWFREEDGQAAFEAGVDALQSFVRQLPDTYPVEPTWVVAMGFSQGAAMCYSLLLRAPELMLGVAALAGFLPGRGGARLARGALAGREAFGAH